MEKSNLVGLSFLVLRSWGSEFSKSESSRFGSGGGLSFLGPGLPNLVLGEGGGRGGV